MITPRFILFDMDGVVVDSMPQHAHSWITVLADYGLNLSNEDIYRREGMSGPVSVADIFQEQGVPCPGDSVLAEMIERKHCLFEKTVPRLYPEIEDILGLLNRCGVLLALVTGSPARTVNQVIPSRVVSLFRVVVTAEQLERGKPDPEPYLRAMAVLGADAAQSLVIENAPQGIQSAVAAGIRCLAIETTLPGQYLVGAERVFENHGVLAEFFRELYCDAKDSKH